MDQKLKIGLEARVYQLSADGSDTIPLDLTPPRPSCSNLNSSEPTLPPSVVEKGTSDEASVHLVYKATAKLHKPFKKKWRL